MTPAQQELLDLAILKVAVANHARYGLTAAAFTHLLPQFGFNNPGDALVLDRIEYLIGKGLLEESSKLIGKANRAFKVTEAGRIYEDEH
jgi:hypothetical protein